MDIKFCLPYIDDDVINEVEHTLKSGWITTGSKVKQLESEIQKLCQGQEVICVNSWTSGAILMLKWLGLKEGDEVIIPAYTYAATALAVIHAGGTPVMVDINDDFRISPEKVKEVITERTKAIIAVDFAGLPCDYQNLKSMVTSHEIVQKFRPSTDIQKLFNRIVLLADAAHALGANYGPGLEYYADFTIFSFHAVKNFTTAEGGAICVNLPKHFPTNEIITSLRLKTLNCQTKDNYKNFVSNLCTWKYDIVDIGMKINMPDINAAIGLAQMRKFGELQSRRKIIFDQYNKAFSEYEWAEIPPLNTDKAETSYHIYALRIKGITEDERDLIIREIINHKVAVNVHYIPLPMLTAFRNLGYNIDNYPVSYKNYACEISLPIYPQLSRSKIERIISTVVTAYNKINIQK